MSADLYIEVRAFNSRLDDDGNRIYVDSHPDYINYAEVIEVSVRDLSNNRGDLVEDFKVDSVDEAIDKIEELMESNPDIILDSENIPTDIELEFQRRRSLSFT